MRNQQENSKKETKCFEVEFPWRKKDKLDIVKILPAYMFYKSFVLSLRKGGQGGRQDTAQGVNLGAWGNMVGPGNVVYE